MDGAGGAAGLDTMAEVDPGIPVTFTRVSCLGFGVEWLFRVSVFKDSGPIGVRWL